MAFQIECDPGPAGNTARNYTSIDVNSALENSNCGPTDADKSNKQQCNNIISIRHPGFVDFDVFSVSLCAGDVLQRYGPGQRHQAGPWPRGQQV